MRREKNKRIQKLLLSIFVVMIMTTSILGFLQGRDSEEQLKYKDKTFTKQQNLWVTEINGQKKAFYYFPSQVEDIPADSDAISVIKNAPMLYMTYDPNQTAVDYISQAIFDLDEEFSSLNIYSVKALATENEFGLPVVGCGNATASIPVVYFKQGNQTGVFLNNSCIVVEANTGLDFLRAKDRITYSLAGVME